MHETHWCDIKPQKHASKKKVEAQTQDARRKMQDADAIQKHTQNNIVQFPIIYIRVCKICKVLISNYTCNFFIKNGSYDTIHTFKNYFATVFSVFSFQQNKRYPNGP